MSWKEIAHRLRTLRWLGPAFPLVAFLFWLSGVYTRRATPLTSSNDIWFGADVLRHADWAGRPAHVGSALLHPLSCVLYKLHGAFLALIGLPASRERLPLVALLPMLLGSLALTWAASRLARRFVPTRPQVAGWGFVGIGVLIGPLAVFGPMPESHLLGGAALLVQAVLTLEALESAHGRHLGHAPAANAARDTRRQLSSPISLGSITPHLMWAGIATGCTLGNVLPAALLCLALPRARYRHRVRGVLLLVSSVIAFWALGSVVKVPPARGGLIAAARAQLVYAAPPTIESLGKSAVELVVLSFGVPAVRAATYTSSLPGRPVRRLYPDAGRSRLAWAAAASMAAAVVLATLARRREGGRPDASLRVSLPPLLSLVALHSVYATREAYLFTAHAWPFLLLPAWALFRDSPFVDPEGAPSAMRTSARVLAGTAVILASLQGAIGARSLWRTLPWL